MDRERRRISDLGWLSEKAALILLGPVCGRARILCDEVSLKQKRERDGRKGEEKKRKEKRGYVCLNDLQSTSHNLSDT